MTVIPIFGVIGWDITGKMVRESLDKANGDDIQIHISSVGGLVFDGLEIFNLIKNYEGHKTAVIMGIAASMGSYIPLAADKITAAGNAVMMIHNAYGIGSGTAEDLWAEANVLEGLSNILADAYVKKTGKSLDDIKAMMDSERWFFGQELVDIGLVDEISEVSVKADKIDEVKKAMAEFATAKNLVLKYEGGDNIRRVAAMIDSMIPCYRNEVKVKSAVGTRPEKAIPLKVSIKMTIEEIKAQHPEVYAAVLVDGIKAEQARFRELSAWIEGHNADTVKIATDAIYSGKSFSEVQSQLMSSASKVSSQLNGQNAPMIITSSLETASGASSSVEGLTENDIRILMAGNHKANIKGMSIEEIRANARKGF